MDEFELLPLALMARRLRVKSPALADAARRGVVPSVQLGDAFLFNVGAVERALAALAVETPATPVFTAEATGGRR